MALPDEAFVLQTYIKPDRILPNGQKADVESYEVQQVIFVEAQKRSVYLSTTDFADETTLLRFGADDAERIGVLLQYAAMKARENGESSATA